MLLIAILLLLINRGNSDLSDYYEYEYPFADEFHVQNTKFSSSDPVQYKIAELILNKDLFNECATVIYNAILKNFKTSWILQMMDATPDIPSGIHEGNLIAFGNFDECLAIDETINGIRVLGQYCTEGLHIKMDHNSIKLSVCIPSVCNLTTFFRTADDLTLHDNMCQTKETLPKWDGADWMMAVILVFLLIIIGLSTFYEIFLNRFGANPRHKLMVAFSAYNNGKKLLSTKRGTDYVDCLDGLRFISILWIIAGHRFLAAFEVPLINRHEAMKLRHSPIATYIHAAHITSCSFFFMTAFLVSYNYFKDVIRQTSLTFRNLHFFYLHRIIRIAPSLIALYLMHITILRSLGTGPLWPEFYSRARDPCIKSWWTFLLFIQNYVNPKEMCFPTTWYLSADMQLFMLSPFIVIPLGYVRQKHSKTISCAVFVILFSIGIIIPTAIDINLEKLNGFDSHSRLSTCLTGIFMGMFLAENRFKKLNIQTVWNVVIWIAVLLTMFSIVILTGAWYTPHQIKIIIYKAIAFPLWSICLSWIIYTCAVGRGGPVNWLLSRPLFHIMAKLSYAMFLMHNPLLLNYVGRARTAIAFYQYDIIHMWCGDVFFTTILAAICLLAFELPAANIEKIIFKKDEIKNNSPAMEEELLGYQ